LTIRLDATDLCRAKRTTGIDAEWMRNVAANRPVVAFAAARPAPAAAHWQGAEDARVWMLQFASQAFGTSCGPSYVRTGRTEPSTAHQEEQ